jgi:hypothetical protein
VLYKSYEFTSVILSVFYWNIACFDYIYNFLLQTFKEVINLFLYLRIYFVWWWSITLKKKKNPENCIIVRSAWCRVSVIFRVIALSPNTQHFKSKFIPYHLIISKHKYYVMKFMFHFLFLHCILWSLRFLWRLSICITDFLKHDTKSPQFFNQLFRSVLHEKLNDWKITSKKFCIFLFVHDLFAICGFS